ncbi:hypothetical protein [Carnobacterium sp. 17-4]|uniref:hypothetical protein n=1 Tax=Carnobacterium sp. (strain 17-4) TaxID=208596 RepID=UPI0005A0ED49|nr:hypothetical protein [Carnobacterium sp. 17-4]
MLNTSKRRLSISKWLKDNNPSEFYEPLKLQKYLFFYELFSKVEGKSYSLDYLKGYENGPVFSEVYGDYTYRIDEFEPNVDVNGNLEIEKDIAQKASFLAQILTKKELSNLTHEMNIWKAKEKDIEKGIKNVPLDEEDFNDNDEYITKNLKDLYSNEFINSVNVINIADKSFVVSKEDFYKLNSIQKDTLELLSNEELDNPVYISIGDEGELLVD